MTSHIAISLMFEQALQAINPSIALPYWDFTIEGTEYNWTNFRHSSVFADDWFGSAAPRNVRQAGRRGRHAVLHGSTNCCTLGPSRYARRLRVRFSRACERRSSAQRPNVCSLSPSPRTLASINIVTFAPT